MNEKNGDKRGGVGVERNNFSQGVERKGGIEKKKF